MSVKELLLERSGSKCELCESSDDTGVYPVPPLEEENPDRCIMLCASCSAQLSGTEPFNPEHWRCLSSSMWSTVPAVQVVAWRLLKRLSSESWADELLEMLYLDEALQSWAEQGIDAGDSAVPLAPTLDSNGTELAAGDKVTLIKDLDVKGAGFTAKRGTMVKNISLTDNPGQIEGRVNGVRIVLLTKYLKKAG